MRLRKKEAFSWCSQLTTVIIGEGLKEIGEKAFCECTSLREILITSAVNVIKDSAFEFCLQLTMVILGEGLEEIGRRHLKIAHH
jgi:hypothetical protein